MQKHTEIKPCPFCGSEHTSVIVAHHCHLGNWRHCHNCNASGSRKATAEEADAAWNKRWADPNTRTLAEIHQIVDAVKAGIDLQIAYADPEEDAMDPDGLVYKPCW